MLRENGNFHCSSSCLETFIEGFKDNDERFQAVGREIEADTKGTDDGGVDLCGVDTFPFFALTLWLYDPSSIKPVSVTIFNTSPSFSVISHPFIFL
jgi:hypothetical protein